ncbi:LytR/AlgR family response regulator transcription factor [Spirosoma rhododendri]|uniref:LytTR family transcriptional regulator n=1 Tax=Spirosoma rhododendri TaxID=2728024 RepID=A0A7L5DKZ7_9BACT|nr:LytTR family DNA-binding domain-containing protein [Spirosoma rhododendri]QJD78181.1 LytTR family transcriptional regulator [Spirosoma rhododendri]
MVSLLRQPYPIEEPARTTWIRAVLIGAFIGLFLLVFQPFDISDWHTPYKTLKVLGFGVVSFAVTALHFLVWPRLFPAAFSDRVWTVGKAILMIVANILLVAVANQLYLIALTGRKPSVAGWVGMLVGTFLVGIFPTAGGVVAGYVIRLRRYVRQAAELPVHPHASPAPIPDTPTPTAVDTLTLLADNEKDSLTLPPDKLLYIESSDNYCTVVYLKNEQPVKPLLRSSLSRLEGQISMPDIVRCHRSFIVNLDRVEKITGNAQGYKLHLLGGQYQIPVARKYNDSLVARLKSL